MTGNLEWVRIQIGPWFVECRDYHFTDSGKIFRSFIVRFFFFPAGTFLYEREEKPQKLQTEIFLCYTVESRFMNKKLKWFHCGTDSTMSHLMDLFMRKSQLASHHFSALKCYHEKAVICRIFFRDADKWQLLK